MKRHLITTIIAMAALFNVAHASDLVLGEESYISLLTFTANDEIHAMYGHTAIRVCDTARKLDTVFNYGTFDFNSSNFLYRFIKGETDYKLAAAQYQDVYIDAAMRSLGVVEQVLNLTVHERNKLWNYLRHNIQPQYRYYRYSFLFDNCATRPLKVIEESVDGTVEMNDKLPNSTFRERIHECTSPYPWVTFGIDLVLGSRVDEPLTFKEQLFLPYYLYEALRTAVIHSPGSQTRPLVKSEEALLEADTIEITPFPISPLLAGIALSMFVFSLSLIVYKRNSRAYVFDGLLFSIYGIAGCIIFFLVFVSEHPAVSPNWNAIWLHPFHLLFSIMLMIPGLRKYDMIYHQVNMVLIVLFLLVKIIVIQQFHPVINLFVLPLLFRSVFQILLLKKLQRTNYR